MRLLRQLFSVFTVLGILFAVILIFSYDIVKIEWISFMEIQPSYRPMEDPLPPPERSIPIEDRLPFQAWARRKTRSRLTMRLLRAASSSSSSIARCAMGKPVKGQVPLLPSSRINLPI